MGDTTRSSAWLDNSAVCHQMKMTLAPAEPAIPRSICHGVGVSLYITVSTLSEVFFGYFRTSQIWSAAIIYGAATDLLQCDRWRLHVYICSLNNMDLTRQTPAKIWLNSTFFLSSCHHSHILLFLIHPKNDKHPSRPSPSQAAAAAAAAAAVHANCFSPKKFPEIKPVAVAAAEANMSQDHYGGRWRSGDTAWVKRAHTVPSCDSL